MLTSLHIQNFKGFKDTLIPELRKVNLILGGQNVGKTSLLEAVVFVAGDFENYNSLGARNHLPQMFRPCEGAGDAVRFWKDILGTEKKPTEVSVEASFKKKSLFGLNNEYVESYVMAGLESTPKASVGVSVQLDGFGRFIWYMGKKSEKMVNSNISYPQGEQIPSPFSAFSKKSAEQVALYGHLVTGKKKKQIVQLLNKIEPRLESIDAVAPDGEHRIYVELSDADVLRPLSQLGHGFTRLFELYAGLAVTESKLALIDEIENGIHYSALPTLFQGVRELAESNDVQSLITTHSLECIKSAYEVFQDKLEDFQLIRLERTDDGNVRAVAINDENLKTIMESGWEIR